MFKSLNTKTLLLILVILGAGIVLVYMRDAKKGGRTFKDELVNIDSSKVDGISLFPQSEHHAEIKFTKSGKSWQLQNDKMTAEADSDRVHNLIRTLKLIKPLRLAGNSKEQWKDFNVDDSLGTRVKFMSGAKTLADIVVGKFSYNNTTRSGISYVRLYDDEDIYAIDGFISMGVNQPFNQWRNKMLLKGDSKNFSKLTFSYPADSGFVLSKESNKWMIDNALVDSNKVKQYLGTLSHLGGSNIVNDYTPTSSMYSLTVEGNNMNPVTIKGFAGDTTQKVIVNSSSNPSIYFSSGKEKLANRIFKSKSNFLPAAK